MGVGFGDFVLVDCDVGDGCVIEEVVYVFYDFGDDVLYYWGVCFVYCEGEDVVLFLVVWEVD